MTEQRISAIMQSNPEWGHMIIDFVHRNPIFAKYLPIVAMQNKCTVDDTKSVRDCILRYICYAGVNTRYGDICWDIVKHAQTEQELRQSDISIRKKEYLLKAFNLSKDFTLEDMKKTKIPGFGPGGQAHVTAHCANLSTACESVEYTDRIFQSGLQRIYGLPKRPSAEESHKLVETWGRYKAVGNTFCFQVHHYGNVIKQ